MGIFILAFAFFEIITQGADLGVRTWQNGDSGFTKPTLFPYQPYGLMQVKSLIAHLTGLQVNRLHPDSLQCGTNMSCPCAPGFQRQTADRLLSGGSGIWLIISRQTYRWDLRLWNFRGRQLFVSNLL